MMKKLLVLGALAMLGFVTFGLLTTNSSSASAETEGKVVLFGKVDFSDDDNEDDVDLDYSTEEESEDSNEGGWLENFIKSHKTPFSKTIKK
ncbi:hypothetical protein SAG0136_03290 [Streptococcus agalactiae LMG 14747]|uniref:Uncharacterized protein n=1 Tax=Streptococcus agalactiae LMG 14747 TaxID=1154860 RepID=V6Z0D0_STRAG|nr:hypothetical protein SAG0136_03290 [Streptococcus agalactiae LMG 14747]